MADGNFVYLTRERIVEIEKELKEMKINGRKAMAEKIAEARAHGDLSENAEYDAAKDAQGMLEFKISKLQNIIATARILDDKKIDSSKAYILSTVKILNHNTSKKVEYKLVSEKEADHKTGKISIKSPIGKGLIGKAIGDVVDVEVPAGIIKLEILAISR